MEVTESESKRSNSMWFVLWRKKKKKTKTNTGPLLSTEPILNTVLEPESMRYFREMSLQQRHSIFKWGLKSLRSFPCDILGRDVPDGLHGFGSQNSITQNHYIWTVSLLAAVFVGHHSFGSRGTVSKLWSSDIKRGSNNPLWVLIPHTSFTPGQDPTEGWILLIAHYAFQETNLLLKYSFFWGIWGYVYLRQCSLRLYAAFGCPKIHYGYSQLHVVKVFGSTKRTLW